MVWLRSRPPVSPLQGFAALKYLGFGGFLRVFILLLTLLYLNISDQVLKIITIFTQNAAFSLLRHWAANICLLWDFLLKIFVLTGQFWSDRTEEKKSEMVIGFEEKGRGGRKRTLVEGDGEHKVCVHHLRIHLVHPQRQEPGICGNVMYTEEYNSTWRLNSRSVV